MVGDVVVMLARNGYITGQTINLNGELYMSLPEVAVRKLSARGECSDPFDMTMPAISKHLKVLARTGLIERRREAQYRPCRLQAEPLKDVAEWLPQYRRFWEESFDRLDDYLQRLQSEEKERRHDP